MEVVTESSQSPDIVAFLSRQGLDPDPGAGFTVSLREDGRILACGSLDGNVIKGVAVDPAFRGQGLTEKLMTVLRQEAFRRSLRELFVFTKPGNEMMFRGLGFYSVARTADALLLESRRGGIRAWLGAMEKHDGLCGAVVMNCAPFTKGHRYLIETAASRCHWLYVFVLSEDKGMFRASDRLEMVRRGCRGLPNVLVYPTEGYLISNATFPTYFLKDKSKSGTIHCALDVEIFAGKVAPGLGLSCRFVGTEPNDPVTAAYNRALREKLPPRGVEVHEIQRLEEDGQAVSASRVRAALAAGDWEAVRPLVPDTTYAYLKIIIGGET